MRIVIALADDVLRKRGVQNSAQEASSIVRSAAALLARVAQGHDLVIVQTDRHGPSRDLQGRTQDGAPYGIGDGGFDTRTDCGLALELGHHLLQDARRCATLVVSVEADLADPAFQHSDSPVGAAFSGACGLAAPTAKHGPVACDAIGSRRVARSAQPVRLVQPEPLRRLVEQGAVVLCTVESLPLAAAVDGHWQRVDALVDAYAGAALVAQSVQADLFIIATRMAGVFLDWGTANSKLLRHAHPSVLGEFASSAGAMAPKLHAASRFAEHTGRRAAIGALADVARLVEGTAGTTISCERADPRGFAGGAVAC